MTGRAELEQARIAVGFPLADGEVVFAPLLGFVFDEFIPEVCAERLRDKWVCGEGGDCFIETAREFGNAAGVEPCREHERRYGNTAPVPVSEPFLCLKVRKFFRRCDINIPIRAIESNTCSILPAPRHLTKRS